MEKKQISLSEISGDDLSYIKQILLLQGDVEYGFYNLFLEWQSKDHTTSEQRWRVSRIVTDEVGQGLNIVRMVRQIGDSELQKTLETKKLGNHIFPLFNSRLTDWSEVIAFSITVTRIDRMNLDVLAKSFVNELSEWAASCLLQSELHLEFARNSVIEIQQGKSKLGNISAISNAVNKFTREFDNLYSYNQEKIDSNFQLGITFEEMDIARSSFLKDIDNELQKLQLK